MPRTPFVIGLWPSDDNSATLQMLRAEFGANHYASTLREAVETCVATAKAQENEPIRRVTDTVSD
jgi:hypothetical protein